MAWGRRKQENEPTVSAVIPAKKSGGAATESTGHTLIGPSIVFRGEVDSGTEDVHVLGKVIGKINSNGTVHVGTSGVIEGDVACGTIVIEGQVKGKIDASNNITIEASGSLTGDTVTKKFNMVPGAFFEGYSHMLDGKKPKKEDQTLPKQHKEVG